MRRGFTLMEIMVVVVIIAVLSEVAAPMVSSITDESRRSATKGKMKALKDALKKYKMDLGRFPHTGNIYNAAKINDAGVKFMNSYYEKGHLNPLIDDSSGEQPLGFNYLFKAMGDDPPKYIRKWKGPYMSSEPSDFFADGWDGEIYYVYNNRALWLHSYGPDGESASPTCFLPNNDTDDIVMIVEKLKF